ncbi:MAG: hypothetical protein KGL53_15235, partial [Elusimicrobia bacterium]|nr:hypothetical protein [Elusimicrobiota bacterium]
GGGEGGRIMGMARRPREKYVTVPVFETAIAGLKTELLTRIGMEMDRRFQLTASQASVDSLTAKVDRFLAALDRSSGEAADNRRTLTIYDSVLGDHRRSLDSHERRLSALESRQPPQTP